jgi:anaerobic sulfite reductase subunit C
LKIYVIIRRAVPMEVLNMSEELIRIEACRAINGCPHALGDINQINNIINATINNTKYISKRQNILLNVSNNAKPTHYKPFKIALAGCPNCCSQPQIKDFGVYKKIYPSFSEKKCNLCKRCIKACKENAIYISDNKIKCDISKCVGCAQCIKVCPNEAVDTHKEYWQIMAGGKLGRHPQLAVNIASVDNPKDIVIYLKKFLKHHLKSKSPNTRLGDLLLIERYDLSSLTLKSFLEKINTIKPYPGAGSSMAVTGAIGVSLIGMAVKISINKVKNHPSVNDFLNKTNELTEKLLNLGQEDINTVALVFSKEQTKNKLMVPILKIAQELIPFFIEYKKNYYSWSYPPVKSDADAGLLHLKICIEGILHLCTENLKILDIEAKEKYNQELYKLNMLYKFLE